MASAWEEKGRAAIEKSFLETGKPHTEGKEFLSIKAVGWKEGQLPFVVELSEVFADLEGRFRFEATAEPANLAPISNSTVSKAKL